MRRLFLILTCCFAILTNGFSQSFQLKGRVTDETDKPVAGATVSIAKTSAATLTDSSGTFNIQAAKGDVLDIKSVGYNDWTAAIANRNALAIHLTPSANQLNDVVVTALGIKREKREVGYATQSVQGTSLQKAPETNVASNLVGKVAGLSVYTKSTLYENPEVYLRGESALVVIDGIPSQTDFWNINPNDIDNVTVLKGTAASALYGSLGINGAIMITTKKGKGGANGMEVSYNSTTQFQAGYLNLPKTQKDYGMGWDGYYAFVDGKGGGGWYDDYGYVWGPKLNVKNPNTASGYNEYPQYNSPYNADSSYAFTENGYTDYSHYKPLPAITRGQNNLQNFLRNEISTSQNISVSGKTDKSDYRISVSHVYQRGEVPDTKFNATTLSLAGSLKVTNKFRVEGSLSYNKQYTPNYDETGYGPNNFFYNILLWMGPDVNINDLKNYWQPAGGRTGSNGEFIPYGVKNIQQFNYNYTWYNNPWFLAYENLHGYTNDVVVAQVNGTYDFTKDLQLLVRSGITTNNAESSEEIPYSYINYGVSAAPKGAYGINNSGNLLLQTDALLTYKKTFLQNFHATISAGASTRFQQAKTAYANTNGGLNVPADYNINNSINPLSPGTDVGNTLYENQVNSLYGYAEIGYKSIAYINLTGRNDWTTTLQKPNNSFFYPSASLSVIVSEIFKLPEFISLLKLRGSYANISSDVAPYYTLPVYSLGTSWNGNASLSATGNIINPSIQPRKTISNEYGAEVSFLKNRIDVDFTTYNYLEKNFPKSIPISQASGSDSLILNADEINRKGIELIVSGTPVRTKTFNWNVTLNYSQYRRTVKSYYGGDTIRDGVKLGERTDVYRGYTWETSPDGQIVYGSNGLPQYINQLVNLGHTDPDWEFGFTNSFNYKSFGLSFSFDGRIGGVIYDGVEQKLYEGGMNVNTDNHYRDDSYAGKANYIGKGVVVTSGDVKYDEQGNVISDTRKFAPNTTPVKYIDWIFATYVNGIDGADMYKRTFVKLREVVLTYNLPSKLVIRTPFKAASISVTGRNLALFTKVPDMDPDGYSGTTLADPSYRNIGINLNLKF